MNKEKIQFYSCFFLLRKGQEWAYAAEILAVDQAQLQKAFVKVNALLGDIASGDIDTVNEKLKLIGLTRSLPSIWKL